MILSTDGNSNLKERTSDPPGPHSISSGAFVTLQLTSTGPDSSPFCAENDSVRNLDVGSQWSAVNQLDKVAAILSGISF